MVSLLLYFFLPFFENDSVVLIPINSENRESIASINLTKIGQFGIERIARPGIPSHLHTGIDIKPPKKNYTTNEYIYSIANGIVISKRTDGPFGQLIIEHERGGSLIWTIYEHITEIQVDLFQTVNPHQPIARFFKVEELDKIGWQFNHFHFEVLKKRPSEIKATAKNPERLFNAYTLTCFDKSTLDQNYYNPLHFLKKESSN